MPILVRHNVFGFLGFLLVLAVSLASSVQSKGLNEEAYNTRLVGAHPLHGKSAYQPIIKKQNGRYIVYIGHHSGGGTSIVDATNPAKPVYLTHLESPAGSSQMVQACRGDELPEADPGKTYLLRTKGNDGHEIWDVTAPAKPTFVATIIDGLSHTHKNWWECKTGIAYLISDLEPDGWSTSRGLQIFDLSNPAKPKFIRNFGLIGSEPGGNGSGDSSARIHEVTSDGKRVYVAYGTGSNGVVQILDREKLINHAANPKSPKPRDLLMPQISRLDLPSYWGGHTAWPILGLNIPGYEFYDKGNPRDFLVLVSETNDNGCREDMHHMAWFLDITEASKLFPVSNFQVNESTGMFCRRGGRFGTHSVQWSTDKPFYGKVAAFPYFNAGMRAVDVRDPYHPKEVAYYIPAINKNTQKRCDSKNGCKTVIQTNNVEVDDRGLIYLADRAGTGLHIVELTGTARAILKAQ